MIRGGDGAAVKISAEIRGRDRDAVTVDAERSTKGVRVVGKPARRMRNYSASVDLVIEVPAKFDLDLDSMGGGFRIEDVEGEITGETMGGAITLRRGRGDVENGGNLALNAGGSLPTHG